MDDLRRHAQWSPADSTSQLTLSFNVRFRQAKVPQLKLILTQVYRFTIWRLTFHQNIVEFYVSMHHFTNMSQVSQTPHNVSQNHLRVSFAQKLSVFRILLLDETLEVSLVTVVHEKVQIIGSLQGPVQLHDILMRHLILQNIDFSPSLALHFLPVPA